MIPPSKIEGHSNIEADSKIASPSKTTFENRRLLRTTIRTTNLITVP